MSCWIGIDGGELWAMGYWNFLRGVFDVQNAAFCLVCSFILTVLVIFAGEFDDTPY
jgi:hypothetical protein